MFDFVFALFCLFVCLFFAALKQSDAGVAEIKARIPRIQTSVSRT